MSWGSALSIRPRRVEAAAPSPRSDGAAAELARLTRSLRRAAEELEGATALRRTGGRASTAAVASSGPLGLSTQATAARLSSTEEINSIATSFSDRGPEFAGSSTTRATLGGIYDGSQGDDTLTFRVTVGGIVGLTPVQVGVENSQGQTLETLSFGLGYSPGSVVTLENGLELRLGSGTAAAGDTFEVDVSATVGSQVVTGNAFNGTRNDSPNFEPGFAVSAGSFEVNGIAIQVLDDDSIDSVLAKISSSEAGVEATFDAATETIVFQQKTSGSAATVVLGDDTTGFLAATKLAEATVVAGTDNDLVQRIEDVAALSAIQSGSFSVNGVNLSVDVGVDTLQDVLDRISQSAAAASASFESTTNTVRIATSGGAALTLDNGSSNLFSALGLTPGTVAADEGRKGSVRFRDEARFRRKLDDFADALNDVFQRTGSNPDSPEATLVHANLRAALSAGLEGSTSTPKAGTVRVQGLAFDFEDSRGDVLGLRFGELRDALRRSPEELARVLLGDGSRRGGILNALEGGLDKIAKGLSTYLGANDATLLDVRA